jgi:hypothetical protein
MAREPQNGRIGGGVLKDNLNLKEDNGGKDFLNFKNESGDTALLHIDAVNKRIGVNTEAPVRDLYVPVKIRSEGVNADTVELPIYTINNSNITANVGEIYLNAADNIQLSALSTDQILIDGDRISTYDSNADLELIPSGTGTVEIYNQLNVYGNLSATGNLDLGGNLIFGDGPETPDRISFDTTVKSDILLDTDNLYKLGSETNRWANFYSNFLNGQAITSGEITVGADSLELRQGNIFYVAVNGDDTNVGDHQQGPFKTIKRALQAADSSAGGPVTIYIFPGDYEEEFPLTIPSNTTVTGHNIRTVTIRPDTSSQSEDAFLMNGESTVENVTIKDFYYDSINDKGYAFRFAPGAVVSSRSPYIRNVSVITQGTTITVDDPRGFASGDAGKGALIDGAVVDPASVNASMLFHSATFITPGVDAITMTNGVRVEWLNSFTYFANRGLYAVRGATGHLSTDGSTVEYGAEIRSIGSANVYGNYGAVADGLGTIMYLIQHNFAYIGSGKFVDNDQTRVVHDQETLQLNSGRIYHQSTDEQGTFNVGSAFFVNFESGTTSIDANSVDFDGLSTVTISSGDDATTLSTLFVETGNIRFDGNTVYSTDGAINITSISSDTNINSNVSIEQSLDITGDVTIAGALVRFGNQFEDTLTFNVPIEQDLKPDTNSLFNLGSPLYRWNKIFTDDTQIDDIKFNDNFITTTASNANLEFLSNGVGTVNFENVTFNTDTIGTVSSDLILDTPSNLRINADSFVLPNGTNAQRINGEADIRFNTQDNVFEGYSTANVGFGGIYSDDRRTAITAHPTDNTINIKVNAANVGEVNSDGLEIHGLQADSIFFNNNSITTVDSNADLDVRRNGAGAVYLDGQEYFRNNIWTNANSSGALNIYNTTNGYVKINSTYGSILTTSGDFIFEDTNDIALGTGLSGSTLFTSLTGGVEVLDAGNGLGETSGFASYGSGTGRHYKFVGANDRSIVTDVYDLTNFIGGAFIGKVICGNNFNGGEVPNGAENLELQCSDDGITWETLGIVADAPNFAVYSAWTDFDIRIADLPAGLDPATIRFRIVQTLASETSGDNYAVAQVGFRYSTEESSSPETGSIRFSVGNRQLEVYNGTDWIASTGIEEDPVTEEYMTLRTEIWSLILG